MRGLIVKTGHFYFKDKVKSTRPKGIKKHREFDKEGKSFTNLITIWLCVEKDDKEEYLYDLLKRIQELNETFYHLEEALVIPFGHMSNNLASPSYSKELLEKLTELLKKENFKVDRVTFGTHKDLAFEIPGQPAQVSYFEFPRNKV